MKRLWHLWILLALSLITLFTGGFVSLAAGTRLESQLNTANASQITEYIAFDAKSDPTSITSSTISKVDNPFFLASYGVDQLLKAKFYTYVDNTPKLEYNSALTSYKAGLIILLVIGPVLFCIMALDAFGYILYLQYDIRKYSQVEKNINKRANVKHGKRKTLVADTIAENHKKQVLQERKHLKSMLDRIAQSDASEKALYVGKYDFKFSKTPRSSARFRADNRDPIYSNYVNLHEGDTFKFRNHIYQYLKSESFMLQKENLIQILAKDIKQNELATIIIGHIDIEGNSKNVK